MHLFLIKLKFLTLSLLICSQFALANERTITVSVGNTPPYVDQYRNQGPWLFTVEHALAEADIDYEINFTNWSDAALAVDLNSHLSFGWQKNKERDKKWLFSQPIYKFQFVFLARKDKRFYWQRYDQLRPYRIGLSRIQTYGPLFDSYIQYLNFKPLNSEYSGIKAMLNDELDVILIEKRLALYLLNHLSEEQQSLLELQVNKIVYEEPVYLVCAKSFRQCEYVIEVFNVGLNKVKSSNEYKDIMTITH